jgi:hypothetical protein
VGCPNRLFDLRDYLYENPEGGSITTLFRRGSDVGLGYTPLRQTKYKRPPFLTRICWNVEMPSINSVRVSLTQIKNLQNLFVLLESFQVSRFSLSRTADGPKDASLDERIKAFASQMSTFELGELRTWGWPVDPKYLNCWSWNANVLAVVRENFPEWLNATGDPQITWSFFHRLRLKLNLDGTQVATFTDLLPAEIAELQSLGLECEIETKWKAALPDPRQDAKDRLATAFFGPHQELKYGSKLIQPFWWTDQHDALILSQVKERQWLWRADHQHFTATLSRKDLQRYEDVLTNKERKQVTGEFGTTGLERTSYGGLMN